MRLKQSNSSIAHRLIKVLGNGEIDKALTVKVHAASDSARSKIEAAGGTVELIES